MAKHVTGKKITRSHTTAIDPAAALIKRAEKIPEITKISLGVIVHGLKAGKHRIKLTLILGGVKATVRGSISKQEIFFFTQDSKKTLSELQKVKK